MGRPSGRLQWATCLDQVSQVLNTLNADLLPFCQMFPGKIEYKRATERLLQELQTLGYKM
ncbi:hypothetical protein I79_006408 [Cricetulus griseus]|uniref:Uncharacterized protein n=1 Tax=Cricetulus griseus TaxID=10029 RepID=G3H7S0_CRIGR|nr:hypothetical protein I79_006408 [Cricetulus griseus]